MRIPPGGRAAHAAWRTKRLATGASATTDALRAPDTMLAMTLANGDARVRSVLVQPDLCLQRRRHRTVPDPPAIVSGGDRAGDDLALDGRARRDRPLLRSTSNEAACRADGGGGGAASGVVLCRGQIHGMTKAQRVRAKMIAARSGPRPPAKQALGRRTRHHGTTRDAAGDIPCVQRERRAVRAGAGVSGSQRSAPGVIIRDSRANDARRSCPASNSGRSQTADAGGGRCPPACVAAVIGISTSATATQTGRGIDPEYWRHTHLEPSETGIRIHQQIGMAAPVNRRVLISSHQARIARQTISTAKRGEILPSRRVDEQQPGQFHRSRDKPPREHRQDRNANLTASDALKPARGSG